MNSIAILQVVVVGEYRLLGRWGVGGYWWGWRGRLLFVNMFPCASTISGFPYVVFTNIFTRMFPTQTITFVSFHIHSFCRFRCWIECGLRADGVAFRFPDESMCRGLRSWDIRWCGGECCEFGLNNSNLALGSGGFIRCCASGRGESGEFLNRLCQFLHSVRMHFLVDFHR